METYNGHVRTPADAIVLFEACRLGLLPRVQRRLSEKERQSIKSGSVFVWDEREAGMRRWTDGKSWSASRVSGSFLTYREMEGKRGGTGFVSSLAVSRAGKTPESTRGSDSDAEGAQEDGPDGYRYKPDGLMKQSFSITTSNGNHLHLISYYSRSSPNAQSLNNPTSDPSLRSIRPAKGMYPESTVHEQQNIPAVTRTPMASAGFSTTPHMAGYARGPPPPPPSSVPQHNYAPPGYGWSPSHLPPHPAYGYHYGPSPIPANGPSPVSYSQPTHVPPPHSAHPQYQQHPQHPQHQQYPHHLQHPQYSQGHARYEHSPVPRQEHSPSLTHHRTSSSSNGMPHYPRNPSPHGSQAPPLHPQQQAAQPQNRPPSSDPPMSKIDPRLMVPSPLAQQPNHPSSYSRSPSPMPPRQESSNSTPTHANGHANGASSIPSIGSIMNEPNNTNGEAPVERVDRSPSRSPGGTKRSKGPKDIPGHKMGFVEDKRALSVLDRAFKT
ncbi:MAG: hypothetical protein LQ349_004525 [Xanthoria aureola]|nr:MAG: hypothetical protein LQ349_004525 [Xanthoria aureola]